MNIINSSLVASDMSVAIILSRFNQFMSEKLLIGAVDILKRVGQVKENNITVAYVPGAYEMPLLAKMLARSKKYDGIISLGVIIRGSTDHAKHIAQVCSLGLSRVSMCENLPISFGILVTENIEQAIERSGSKLGNKGSEAAFSILEMFNLAKIIK